jgi:hypothetical protein
MFSVEKINVAYGADFALPVGVHVFTVFKSRTPWGAVYDLTENETRAHDHARARGRIPASRQTRLRPGITRLLVPHPARHQPLHRRMPAGVTVSRGLFPRAALLRFAFGQKICHNIFFSSKANFNIVLKPLPKPRQASLFSEKLARYASTALSTVEHLTLLVGKESIALALMRHFGSLKALSRASLLELRQFVPQQKAEPIIAALSVSAIASPDLFSVQPPFPAWRNIVACWLEAMEMNLSYDMELPNGKMDLGWRPPVWDSYCNLINRTEGKGHRLL